MFHLQPCIICILTLDCYESKNRAIMPNMFRRGNFILLFLEMLCQHVATFPPLREYLIHSEELCKVKPFTIHKQLYEVFITFNHNVVVHQDETTMALALHCVPKALIFFFSQCIKKNSKIQTRMWANAESDGRPAEYRWRPLINTATFGLRPLLESMQ